MSDDQPGKHPWHDVKRFEPRIVRKGGGFPSEVAIIPFIIMLVGILIILLENGG